MGEFPGGAAPEVAVELVQLDADARVFRTTDTGSVTERARSLGGGTYLFRAETDGEFRATLREQQRGLF